MKNVITLIAFAAILFGARPASGQITPPFSQCPAVGADTSCAILIVVTDKAVNVYTDTSQGPYDQIEDTLIGVQNNSSGKVETLPLSSPQPIFTFDGDGICGTDPNTGQPYNPAPPGCPYGPTTYEGPGVSFGSISSDRTSGIVSFTGGLAPGKSTYFSMELAIQTVCPALSGQALSVPLEKQCSSPWGTETYDDYPSTDTTHTNCRLGCALTSSSMIINYFGGSTDPEALNTWLANHNGYQDHGVNWFSVAAYATNVQGVALRYHPGRSPNDFTVDNYLCASDPVILEVTSPHGTTHFVVATGGKATTNNGSTYLINDPGYACTELDQQGCSYNNQYLGIRKFSPGTAPLSGLEIVAGSPVELLVTAPNGQETGFDPVSGKAVQRIPASDYYTESIGDDSGGSADTNPVKKIEIGTPVAGKYTLEVIGTGSGTFKLYISGFDDNGGESMKTFTGTVSQGSKNFYYIQYSPVPGSQISVTTTVPFSTFSALVDISGGQVASFQVNGSFTLGAGSTGINPVTQAVSFQLATYSVTIPAGSFTQNSSGTFVYDGTIGAVSMQVQIAPLGGGSYSFKVDAQGADLTTATNPVPLTLTIGTNSGTTSSTADFQ